MACNLTQNRRRKKWQNFQPENAPCVCDIGFGEGGCCARQWWIQWDQAQLDAKWQWLDGGHVMSYLQFFPGTFCIFRAAVSGTQSIDLKLSGFNEVLEDPEFGAFTVLAEVQVRTDILFPVVTFQDRSNEQRKVWPEASASYNFGEWTTIQPVPGLPSTITGQAIVTPLKPCHDCS